MSANMGSCPDHNRLTIIFFTWTYVVCPVVISVVEKIKSVWLVRWFSGRLTDWWLIGWLIDRHEALHDLDDLGSSPRLWDSLFETTLITPRFLTPRKICVGLHYSALAVVRFWSQLRESLTCNSSDRAETATETQHLPTNSKNAIVLPDFAVSTSSSEVPRFPSHSNMCISNLLDRTQHRLY